MTNLLPFGFGAWAFITLYIVSLLFLGWAGLAARKEDTLQDFYLGGRGFGFSILVLTLYAFWRCRCDVPIWFWMANRRSLHVSDCRFLSGVRTEVAHVVS